jgi:hypothetical protein
MIPETIKIGAYTVTVIFKDDLLRDQGCCGRFLPCEKRIEIDNGMCSEMQWGTFYHEIIEAVSEIYCVQPLAEHHDSINLLGEVLHQILRDNREKMIP